MSTTGRSPTRVNRGATPPRPRGRARDRWLDRPNLHNSGSSEEQKGFVKPQNFATVPLPFGPAKKRASFYFSETLTAFKGAKNREGAWRFMSWLMDDEPNFGMGRQA